MRVNSCVGLTGVSAEITAFGELYGFLFEGRNVHIASYVYNRSMTLKERRVGDVTILQLTGRLVLDDGNDELRDKIEQLAEQGGVNVVVDLKDVTYIDSCGVGLLIAKYVSLRRKGGDLKLLHLTQRSHHLMEISKLLDVFQTFESEEHALASFKHEAQA